jgi:hypothetical protein
MPYRKIDCRINADEKFRSLSSSPPCGKYLFIHLLINSHVGVIPGLYRLSEATLADDLGWDLKGLRKSFEEISLKGMAKADWEAKVVYLPNSLKYNKPASPNVVKSWASQWDVLPECNIKYEAYQQLRKDLESFGEAFREAFDKGCRKPFGKEYERISNPCLNQEQEQELDQEQKYPPLPPSRDSLRSPLEMSKKYTNEIHEIFGYWQSVMNHPNAKLDKKRERAILNSLKKYSLEEIKLAVDGCKKSSYHQGSNQNGKVYDDIELICRNSSTTESFINHITEKIKKSSQSFEEETKPEVPQETWQKNLNFYLNNDLVRMHQNLPVLITHGPLKFSEFSTWFEKDENNEAHEVWSKIVQKEIDWVEKEKSMGRNANPSLDIQLNEQ